MVINRGKRLVVTWNCKKDNHKKCNGILYVHKFGSKKCECGCHDKTKTTLDSVM
ncbi:MAG: hypothetical protein K5790_10495 [Nitrosopumilus sp.]|uniref:hypothetical protein n=1 Tax=Nitrosopumilus sp. TaxID=2024843 RepID=UPI00247BF535|nr:hypothetical protein [Nitrosopumilus sp.]MCV0393699.1 hypothetical protein [Nitrosopumilus sp.]